MSKKTACGKCDTCPCSSTPRQSRQQQPQPEPQPQPVPQVQPQLPPCACGPGGNVPPPRQMPPLQQLPPPQPIMTQATYSCARQPGPPPQQPQPMQQYAIGSRCTCGAKSKVLCSCGAYNVPQQPQYAPQQPQYMPMPQPVQQYDYAGCNSGAPPRGRRDCEHCRRKRRCCTIL